MSEPESSSPAEPLAEPQVGHCPSCKGAIDVTELSPYSKIECPHCAEPMRIKSQLGNYLITGLLGEGGMSQVFNATDQTLNRQVALKILHQNLNSDESLTAMFEREAALTASMTHPNVVKVYTASRDQGYFFIAMELVDSVSVEQMIELQGAVREARVLDLAHDVANGLRAAFNTGLIHRDIKPGNMLVTNEGVAKLVDFGLAVMQGGEDEAEELWATPFYVPPEKLDGQPDTFLGDIYSLGATFFHALAGIPPFPANTSSLEELKAIKAEPVSLQETAPGTISKPTVALVEKMMAYRPEDRPQSYDDLIAEIEAVIKTVPGTTKGRAERATATGPKSGGLSKKTWIKIGAGIAAAIAAAVLIPMLSKDDDLSNTGITDGNDGVVGEGSISEKYTAAVNANAAGNFQEAESAFDSMIRSGQLEHPTLGWAHFHHGLAQLFQGDEKAARPSFETLKFVGDFHDGDTTGKLAAQHAFFTTVGNLGAEPLPALPSQTENLATDDSLDSLALLAAGLKNWNLAEFESGAAFLEKFKTSTLPDGYEWAAAFQGKIDPFLADATALKSLPKPSGEMNEGEIGSVKRQLAEQIATLKTPAAKQFTQARIDRCDAIVAFKAESIRIAKIANDDGSATPEKTDTPPTPDTGTAPPKPMTDSASYDVAQFSAEEVTEYNKLTSAIESAGDLADDYLLGAAGLKIETETFQTTRIRQLHADAVALHKNADRFIEKFTAEMAKGLPEGKVRRKTGVVLDAKITAATRDQLTVNLGFGDNPKPLEEFAADWICEAAQKTFLNPGVNPAANSPELWEAASSFALISGLPDQAKTYAREVRSLAPEYRDAWRRLAQAKLFGLEPPSSASSGGSN